MTSAENRWQSVIDGLGSDLDRIEAGLERGNVAIDLGPFRPPGDLPPLPASMVGVARELSQRYDHVREEVEKKRQMTTAPRRHHPVARSAARFEARA